MVERADKEGNAHVEAAVPVQGEVDDTDEFRCCETPGAEWRKSLARTLLPFDVK